MRLMTFLLCSLALDSCATTPSSRCLLGESSLAPGPTQPSTVGARVEPPDDALSPPAVSTVPTPQGRQLIKLNTPPGPTSKDMPRWQQGGALIHGFLGAYDFGTIRRSGGDQPPVDGSDESLSLLPVFGGGGQWKILGDRLDIGLEALMSFGGRISATAISAGGSGAVVAVDVDLFLIDLYGGPLVSLFLGERLRIYGAVGPMLQWASYEQYGDAPGYDENGSGFGTGWYTRTGLEVTMRRGLMAGAGVRWVDSTVDLGDSLGDMDFEGLQWVFTVTSGI